MRSDMFASFIIDNDLKDGAVRESIIFPSVTYYANGNTIYGMIFSNGVTEEALYVAGRTIENRIKSLLLAY